MKSCLFINSNPSDRAIFVTALFDTSPETICFVADGDRQALDMMSSEAIVPNYILVELSMPGIDSFRLLRRIRRDRKFRKTRVIVHYTASDPFYIQALREVGAFAIYSLPYNYRSMCTILRLYLNEQWCNLCLN